MFFYSGNENVYVSQDFDSPPTIFAASVCGRGQQGHVKRNTRVNIYCTKGFSEML